MKHKLKLIGCLGLLAAVSASAQTPLMSWNAFDALVAAEYDALADDAPCYPPGFFRFGVAVPPLPFDASAFADMTQVFAPQTLAGVPAWTLVVHETQDVSRVWHVAVGDAGIRDIAVPAYDPLAWSQDAYGAPPEWLSGTSLAQWYRERARERIQLRITLIPADRFDEYRSNLHAAATNATPAASSGPVVPSDTNRVAFARVASSPSALSFDVYSPMDVPVDVFAKTRLADGGLWDYAGTVFAQAPFTPSAVAMPCASLFLNAARGDIDTDGDGIPDGMESLALGSNPDLWDSSGDGLSDWTKLYRYGLDPLLRDTDGDGYDDDEEIAAGTNPSVPTDGAGTTIRYYHDEDDRLVAIHAGATGTASTAVLTAAGNAASLRERGAE
jgi:hypothetical protein